MRTLVSNWESYTIKTCYPDWNIFQVYLCLTKTINATDLGTKNYNFT